MKKLFFVLAIMISFLLMAKSANAVTCNRSGTIDQSCSYFYQVDGVDADSGSQNTATLTVTNSVLTITNSQTIASGSFVLGSGGSIVLPVDGSGQIIPDQPLWLKGGFYDTNYPANEAPSLTQVDQSYARLNSFVNQSCKPAQSCPTQCGQPSSVRAGNSSLVSVDGNGSCLYRTCAATATCDAECSGKPNGTTCGVRNECFNAGGGVYLTKNYQGACYNGSCANIICTQAELWSGGCYQTHIGPGSC